MINELNHVGMYVQNLERAMSFYSENFGVKFVRGSYIPSSKTIAVYMQIGDSMLEFLHPLEPDDKTVYGFHHVAYIAEEIDNNSRKLSELGYRFNFMPKIAGSGAGRLTFLFDPNNVNVEIMERNDTYRHDDIHTSADVLELDHISLYADKLQQAVDFYSTIGMVKLRETHTIEDDTDRIYMHKGRNVLELLHNDQVHSDNQFSHLSFRVNDTVQFVKALEEKGVTIKSTPIPIAGGGGCVCYILDPEGVTIEIVDRISLFDMK